MSSTWQFTSELANQHARKLLFTCVVYTKYWYSLCFRYYCAAFSLPKDHSNNRQQSRVDIDFLCGTYSLECENYFHFPNGKNKTCVQVKKERVKGKYKWRNVCTSKGQCVKIILSVESKGKWRKLKVSVYKWRWKNERKAECVQMQLSAYKYSLVRTSEGECVQVNLKACKWSWVRKSADECERV